MDSQAAKSGGLKVDSDGMIEATVHLQAPKMNGRKISPRGVIDLPLAARIALGFRKNESKQLRIDVTREGVRLTPSSNNEAGSVKASARGQMRLSKEAHEVLSRGSKGRYSLEISEEGGSVMLRSA